MGYQRRVHGGAVFVLTSDISKMMKAALVFLLVASVSAGPLETVDNEIAEDRLDLCTICQSGVEMLESYLLNPENMKLVQSYLITGCDYLDKLYPGLTQTCTDFVNVGLPKLVQELMKTQLKPLNVCTMIHLC